MASGGSYRRTSLRKKIRQTICPCCSSTGARGMSSASLCRRVDCEPRHLGNGVPFSLERDDFSSNRHGAPSFCLSMIFSETRYPLFRIMLQSTEPVAQSPARRAERLTRERNVHGFKGDGLKRTVSE